MDVVSADALATLWSANELERKRAQGILQDVIVHRTHARNPLWTDGESRIVKLFTPNGQHIGTLHEIALAGAIVHSHPKDYTLRDCSRVRLA